MRMPSGAAKRFSQSIISARISHRSVNILFLTHRLPFPPNRGDRILAYHLLRHMREYASIDVVSLVHSPDEAAQAKTLSGEVTSVSVCKVTRLRNLARATVALLG